MKLVSNIILIALGTLTAFIGVLLSLNHQDFEFIKYSIIREFFGCRHCLILSLIFISILTVIVFAIQQIHLYHNKPRRLIYKTLSIQNINFIYSNQSWPFKTSKAGEDMISALNPIEMKDGLVTEYPVETNNTRIAEGYIIVDFTLENHGENLVIVDKIELNILKTHKMPLSANFSYYKPVLKEEQEKVVLNMDQKKYGLYKNKTFKYSSGEADAFRLKVMIGKDIATELIYEFQILIHTRVINKTTRIKSDKNYFISNHNGASQSQIDAKILENEEVRKVTALLSQIPPFEKILAELRQANISEARNIISKHISIHEKLYYLRKLLRHNGPPLIELLQLRIYFSIYLRDKKSITEDLNFLNKLDIENFKDFKNEMHMEFKAFKRGDNILKIEFLYNLTKGVMDSYRNSFPPNVKFINSYK